jgi:hypothetical protein
VCFSGTLTAVRAQMISRIQKMTTELEAWTDRDFEPVSNHLKDFCNRFTTDQQTELQPLKFLQALKQLSSKFDWMKENWKSRQITEEIAQMSSDFKACCLMDKQFVRPP